MHSAYRCTVRKLASTILVFVPLVATPLHAQVGMPTRITDGQVFWFLQNLPPESAKPLGSLINALLSDTAGHMRMAEPRAATPADWKRADGIVNTMRSSLAAYKDVVAAEKDGYALFMPWLEEQVVYHYNNMSNAGAARTAFDASRPTSLLYQKDSRGVKVLIGAMYTAPTTATPEELDARLPLGVAHWHQHVNFCAMRPAVAVDGLARNDSTTFAKWLAIDTQEACGAQGGLFVPQLFGWMAHVNAFAGATPAAVWGSEGRDHMHMHHSP
jgi:hypothetical protein